MKYYVCIILIIIFLAVGWFSTSGNKTQLIRLMDIFVLGPFMIWLSTKIEEEWIRFLLIAWGSATISYNAKNWWSEYTFVKDVSVTNPASWGN